MTAGNKSGNPAAKKNQDLHGSAPDKCAFALLLIDVINDLDFPEANQLLRFARPMARRIFRLKQRARKAGVPVIYVNDNFGRWQSDFRRQVQHCLRPESRGHEIVRLLQPEEDDYFVLKPKHSGFFSTTLEILLRYLGSETLVITGIAGNFLRPFHRERRLYARLWLDDSGGLHGLEFCRGKQGSVGADAKIP